ncbi:hypothetical protein LDENG_00007870, partial [Lucifuga dentata]
LVYTYYSFFFFLIFKILPWSYYTLTTVLVYTSYSLFVIICFFLHFYHGLTMHLLQC